MVDFTNLHEELNLYKGSEKKKTIIYNNKKYLVKFPDPIREKNKTISYINNSYSEYIGSNIFKICGFDVQNTILGTYIYKDKEKIVCACEDFTNEDSILYEFESLALSINPDKKIETELSDIEEVIKESNIINLSDLLEKFYDMFIIDALIGNTDRHNGNWGILLDMINNKHIFSPIYDNGSCLNPLLSDDEINNMDYAEIKNLALNCYSCLKEDNKKINYMEYISSKKNKYVNDALIKVLPKINLEKIESFINNIECINDTRKEFYKKIIEYRYDILKNTYNELIDK